MKKLKTVTLVVLLTTTVFAYEKGNIDMHGGKGDSMLGNKGFSNSFKSLSDKKEQLKKESSKNEKFLKVEKIEKIKDIKEKND